MVSSYSSNTATELNITGKGLIQMKGLLRKGDNWIIKKGIEQP